METSVTWKQGLSFTGTSASGLSVPLGADQSAGGNDDGFRPLELMGISLAGCTAMDVISILRKKQQDVTSFEVSVLAERADEHPRVITKATIQYKVTGHNVDEAAVIRAIELSATKYCPAQAMLGKVFPMILNYEIFEDEGEGKIRLVKKGTNLPKTD